MLASGLGEMYELEESERWAREFIAFAAEHDLDTRVHPLVARRHARLPRSLGRGHGARAGAARRRGQRDQPHHRAHRARTRPRAAWRSRRRGRARRGARDIARGRPPPAPRPRPRGARGGRVARRRPTRTLDEARAVYDLALEKRHLWFAGELAYWQWKAGALDRRSRLDRRAVRDGRSPATRGVPPRPGQRAAASYESARALAESDDEGQHPRGARGLRASSARRRRPAVRQTLRSLGASVPRGPRASDAGEPGRAHRARARGSRSRRRGPAERGDRRASRRLQAHGGPPRVGDPSQARRTYARRGGRDRDTASASSKIGSPAAQAR